MRATNMKTNKVTITNVRIALPIYVLYNVQINTSVDKKARGGMPQRGGGYLYIQEVVCSHYLSILYTQWLRDFKIFLYKYPLSKKNSTCPIQNKNKSTSE